MQSHAAQVGEVFIKGMMKLRDEFEVVGDVRGKGLMLGMEMVTDKVLLFVYLYCIINRNIINSVQNFISSYAINISFVFAYATCIKETNRKISS